MTPATQTFDLDKNFSIIELEMSPTLKKELQQRTPQSQLEDKKNKIRQTVYKFQDVVKKYNQLPLQDKNHCLDEYIAELTSAEKILNEIFLELHSDTIKFNFNLFKDFLIDIRLFDDINLKNRANEDLNRQFPILMQELNNF